ncbi:uncharacterized protein LOC101899278 [Musca domestica]|uniref:Uncharacterized protein LOC101899278 n=1 Tax=Musca domestica TaxID=7370 RepID=A0A1I8MKN3_MUSDO|nr:uncharacterized protein LOC101899278 [Musca domestica]
MLDFFRIFTIFLIFLLNFPQNESKIVKFTKLECKDFDKSLIAFKLCQLKAVGRNRIAMQVQGDLKQPLNDGLLINVELFRKSHDFRPFLYNDTMEFCGFIKNPNRYMFWKILVQEMIKYTNLNHTCPYEDELVVKDLILDDSMLKALPFPSNDYMVQVKALQQNDIKAEMKMFIVIIE